MFDSTIISYISGYIISAISGLIDATFLSLTFYEFLLLGTVFGCSLALFDDLFVDLLALLNNKKAEKFSSSQIEEMLKTPEQKIAILIANWQEHEIIERTVAGNINKIQYSNYEFIIGVYPNDLETLAAARRIEKRYPQHVTVVVNTMNGPTSKGQLLNQMVNYIAAHNADKPADAFSLIVIQDSEDVIHRYSLKLMNFRALKFDYIQIPVFSLAIPLSKLTAGIYIDEFIESHTKELLVRDHYNAGLPSAGVGTAITWKTVEKLLQNQNGSFLNEKTLTEDYHLGLSCHDLNVKSNFACVYFETLDTVSGKTQIEYIATREYFPQKIKQSIRQKTRWALGISLQGFQERKWKSKGFFGKYFLWRDRKSLFTSPFYVASVVFLAHFIYSIITFGQYPSITSDFYNTLFTRMMWGNVLFSVFRILYRMHLVSKVYGLKVAILVPIRWILSSFINAASTFNACYQWVAGKVSGELPRWAKTDHIIPVGFGLENLLILEEPQNVMQDADATQNSEATTASPSLN